MERGVLLFWLATVGLLATAVFYGVGAAQQSRQVLQAGGEVATGDVVAVVQTVDGDTVLARKEGGAPVTIRLLGIKAFDTRLQKDESTAFAHAAEAELRQLTVDQPIRLLLHTPAKDRHGRTLATLFDGESDIGLELIRRGLVLVYPVYPFPALPSYVREQEIARQQRRGLWADPAVAARAATLLREWRQSSP
ncbi:MAG: thermonuclease family protein [Verrucomicrobia bacterium]|nr:thermonuclease family protein [Verrucomicrobiota bacterium]